MEFKKRDAKTSAKSNMTQGSKYRFEIIFSKLRNIQAAFNLIYNRESKKQGAKNSGLSI